MRLFTEKFTCTCKMIERKEEVSVSQSVPFCLLDHSLSQLQSKLPNVREYPSIVPAIAFGSIGYRVTIPVFYVSCYVSISTTYV